jgi:hypothetical protein
MKLYRTFVQSCAIAGLGTAFLLTPLSPAKADPLAYEVTIQSASTANLFGTVDLTTGAFVETSALGFTPAGLAEIGSDLYTSVFEGEGAPNPLSFYQINPANGALTTISNTGLGGGEYLALGSTLNGIYALDDSFNLYSINPTTGAATLIGPTGLSSLNPAYQLSTGSPVLYFGLANQLYTLNTSTGAATDIGPTLLSGDGIDGLVFEDGTLYAGYAGTLSVPPTTIYSIDPATGAATFIATQNPAVGLVYGLAPLSAPEPNSLAMLGVALLAFVGFHRRPTWRV